MREFVITFFSVFLLTVITGLLLMLLVGNGVKVTINDNIYIVQLGQP